jgi:hypothetical protein
LNRFGHRVLSVPISRMVAKVTNRLWEIGDIVKVLEDWENKTS